MTERLVLPDAYGERKPRDHFFTPIVTGKFGRTEIHAGINPRDPISFHLQNALDDQWQESGGELGAFRNTFTFVKPPEVVGKKLFLPVAFSSFYEHEGTKDEKYRALAPDQMHEMDAIATSIVVTTGDKVPKLMYALFPKTPSLSTISGYPEPHKDAGPQTMWDPFKTILRELEEEAGITQDKMGDIWSTGIFRNNGITSKQPIIAFAGETRLTATEILERPAEQGVQRIFIDDTQQELTDLILRCTLEPSPTPMGTLMLYGKEKYGDAWYDSLNNKLQQKFKAYEEIRLWHAQQQEVRSNSQLPWLLGK